MPTQPLDYNVEPLVPLEEPKPTVHQNMYRDQAFYAAMVDGTNDMIGTYDQIVGEIESTGNSPLLEEIKDYVSSEITATTAQEIESRLISGDKDGALNLLRGAQNWATVDVELKQEYINYMASIDRSKDSAERLEQDERVDSVLDIMEAQREINKINNAVVAKQDITAVSATADFLEAVIPFVESSDLVQIKEALLNEEGGTIDYFLFGSNKRIIQNALLKMSPEERIEAANKLAQIVPQIAGSSINDNDFLLINYLNDLTSLTPIPDWQVFIENVGGVLDAIAIGVGVKAVTKRVGIRPGSRLDVAAKANPHAGGELAAAALADETGTIAKMSGTTRDEVIEEAIMPSPTGSKVTEIPDDVSTHYLELQRKADDILESTESEGMNLNLTALEKEHAIEARQGDMVESLGGASHVNKTTIARHEDGKTFDIEAVFGQNNRRGFLQPANAQRYAERQGLEDFSVVRLNSETGEFENVVLDGRAVYPAGKYYVQVKEQFKYDPYDALILEDDAIRMGGRKAKWVLDATANFNEQIRLGSVRMVDRANYISKQFYRTLEDDIIKLPRKSQLKVFDVVSEGERAGRNYFFHELQAKGLTKPSEINAYYSFRQLQDTFYDIANRDYRASLDRDSFKGVNVAGVPEEGLYVKNVTLDDVADQFGEGATLYDPSTGSPIMMTLDNLRAELASGARLGRMHTSKYIGNEKMDFALVRGSDTLEPLPLRVVPYIEGYVRRMYEDPWFVRISYKGKQNGRPADLTNTIGVATTRKRAEALIEDLRVTDTYADLDNVEFRAELGKEFMEATEVDTQLTKFRGFSSTRKRGEHLFGEDLQLANIDDPIQATVRTISQVGFKEASKNWIETNKIRFLNTYPEVKAITQGQYPGSIAQLKASELRDERLGQAIAYWEYINAMQGIPSGFDKGWQRMMLHVANTIDNPDSKFTGGVAKFIVANKEKNPIDLIRGTNFLAFLATAPLRQLPVQASQLVQLTPIMPKYVLSPQLPRDIGALSTALTFEAVGRAGKGIELGAKAMKMSEDDFRTVFNSFKETGIPYSIDAKTMLEGMSLKNLQGVEKNLAGAAARHSINALSAPVRAAQKVGFDAGEFIQIAGAYTTALRKSMKENPTGWRKQSVLEETGVAGREYAWTFNRAGRLGIQGINNDSLSRVASIPFQFMGVIQKAILAATYNRRLTKAEKQGLLATNLAAFGTTGIVGLNYVIEDGLNKAGVAMSPEMEQLVVGGLTDLGVNTLINWVVDGEDEESYLDFAKNFSPLNVTGVVDHMHSLWDKPLHQWALGPGVTVHSRFAQAVDKLRLLWEPGQLTSESDYLKAWEAVSSIFSGMSNYYKYKAWQKTGEWFSSRGTQVPVDLTDAEAYAGIFGVQSDKIDDYYSTLKSRSQIIKDVKADAKRLYERTMGLMATEGINHFEVIDTLAQQVRVYEDDPIAQNTLMEEILNLDQRNRKNNQVTLAERLLQVVKYDPHAALAEIAGTTEIPIEERKKLINTVNTLVGYEAIPPQE